VLGPASRGRLGHCTTTFRRIGKLVAGEPQISAALRLGPRSQWNGAWGSGGIGARIQMPNGPDECGKPVCVITFGLCFVCTRNVCKCLLGCVLPALVFPLVSRILRANVRYLWPSCWSVCGCRRRFSSGLFSKCALLGPRPPPPLDGPPNPPPRSHDGPHPVSRTRTRTAAGLGMMERALLRSRLWKPGPMAVPDRPHTERNRVLAVVRIGLDQRDSVQRTLRASRQT